VRILAGAYKGRKLLSPPGRGKTRPITGYVKKSLFDQLGGRLADAAVADLYCGTGTLGLEALSRGAASCCFAERDRAALSRLRRNIEALGVAGRCTVWAGDVTSRLATRLDGAGGAFDVVFIDPPYAAAQAWSWERQAERVFAPVASHLAAGGVAVLRLPTGVEAPETLGPLAVARRRDYGDMVVLMLSGTD
jgi:16S rRNA (guanine(966)-N(2))-methyltransferase RsmD